MMTDSNHTNPWIGLDSYQEGQTLYGRNREIQDLSMTIFHNRQTVVYGRSGIGKTSLLHAGIFPMARLRGCVPVSVRFDHTTDISYREQLIQFVSEAVSDFGGEMTDATNSSHAPQSLWEFFHRMQPQKEGQPIVPLIVIDQFEEIFTLRQNSAMVRAFFEELADAFNDVMPDYLQSDHSNNQKEETGSIFDGLQVNTSDNRFGQEMSYHMVFVLREDYLSYLERYSKHIPALKQNRYGLLPITYRQAMEIITKPRQNLVNEEVADAIIRHITTEQDINDETPIDAAILSLYLSRLYEKKKEASSITLQLVNEQGDALIEDFYAETASAVDRRTIHYLEDQLINADGHRENVSLESLYKQKGIIPSSVEKLERAHLLRIFSYGNVQRVEFAHDVLCPIIVRRRSQRQNTLRMRRAQKIGISLFFVFFLLIFGLIEIIVYRTDSKAAIEKQQARLSEMEVSLIEKGAQKMLDNHDIYGAIQLLINTMKDDLKSPSYTTAREELFLRRAIDSLILSEDKQIASIHRTMYLDGQCVISKSKRICGVLDESRVGAMIIDAQTGAIIQVYSLNKSITNSNFFFSYKPRDTYYSEEQRYLYEESEEGVVAFEWERSHMPRLIVTDIHPNDLRCLLIANDTILLDCFIYTGEDKYLLEYEECGSTYLCIHDVHAKILEAAYTTSGDSIAVLLSDSTNLLYSALTGMRIPTDTGSYLALSEARHRRHEVFDYYEEMDADGCIGYPAVIELNDHTRLSHHLLGEYVLSLSSSKEKTIRKQLLSDTIWTIHISDNEQEIMMRDYLDSIQLPKELRRLQRTYYYSWTDSLQLGSRYLCPMAINTNHNRVAVLLLSKGFDPYNDLYGIYPDNGAIFYHTKVPYNVHTLHFTEDDQYLVVNYGEKTQEVFYMPPLQQLIDTCKNMFFDWEMTDEERYQTYIHMND